MILHSLPADSWEKKKKKKKRAESDIRHVGATRGQFWTHTNLTVLDLIPGEDMPLSITPVSTKLSL